MDLLAESGATGVSLRRIADRREVSVGSLTNRWGTRDRMLHIAINEFRARWNYLMGGLSWTDGLMALLPLSEDEVDDCRVWLAFSDLASTDEVIAECVADQRREERELVTALVRRRGDDDSADLVVDLVIAVVDGLRAALCSPSPMPLARARQLLDRHLQPLGLRAEELRLTGPPSFLVCAD